MEYIFSFLLAWPGPYQEFNSSPEIERRECIETKNNKHQFLIARRVKEKK
jgi:hypothetical protein